MNMNRSLSRSFAINIAAVVLVWLMSFAVVQALQFAAVGWAAIDIAVLIATTIALGIALRLRARVAAALLTAFVAMEAADLAIHLMFGIRSAQGAGSHFAVLSAAIAGVALSLVLLRSSFTSQAAIER